MFALGLVLKVLSLERSEVLVEFEVLALEEKRYVQGRGLSENVKEKIRREKQTKKQTTRARNSEATFAETPNSFFFLASSRRRGSLNGLPSTVF